MDGVLRKLALLLAGAGFCLHALGGAGGYAGPAEERMRNVTVLPPETEKPLSRFFPVSPAEAFTVRVETPAPEEVEEAAVEGGVRVKNETGYWVDASALLAEGPGLTLPADEPQILIIHTHGSQAYTQSGSDRYAVSDDRRTEDTQFNVVRIGDELSEILTGAGLRVIHDRGIYDYPSDTGSYARAGEAIAQYLESCPGIRAVLDIHRESVGAGGVVYKTLAEEEGSAASQIRLVVGTDESGLAHPAWRSNLAFALYLQNAVNSLSPTLLRPVRLAPQRYNQHFTPGSILVEVGSSGNTLREALAAVRLFGRAIAPALLALTEE